MVAVAVIVGGMVGLHASPASASPVDLGWYLDAHGYVHCARDAWHIVCDIFNRAGTITQGYFDQWIAEPCTHGGIAIHAGNDNGDPFYLAVSGDPTNHCGYVGSSFSHVGKCVSGQAAYSTWFEGSYYTNVNVGSFGGTETSQHWCGFDSVTKFYIYGTW